MSSSYSEIQGTPFQSRGTINTRRSPYLVSLEEERDEYIQHCLANSTFRTYESGFRAYASFCSRSSLPMFPLSEENMELFVCSLARRLAFSTIKVYISAVQFHALVKGHQSRISNMAHLCYVLRVIKIFFGSSRSRPGGLPRTIGQLHILFDYINGFLS